MEKSGYQPVSLHRGLPTFYFVEDRDDLETDAAPPTEFDSNKRIPFPSVDQYMLRTNQTGAHISTNQLPDMRIRHFEGNCSGILTQVQPSGHDLVDAVIVYAKDDYEDVMSFIGWLQSLLNHEGIYDCRIFPFDDERFCQDKVMNVDDVVSKATHALMFLTPNFVRDVHVGFYNCEAIAQTRLAQGPDASSFASIFLMKNKYAVRPVHTERTSSRRYRTPSGLSSLMSIDYYDKHTKHTCMKTTQLLKNAIAKRKKLENELNSQQRNSGMQEREAGSHHKYENDERLLFNVPSADSFNRLQQHKLDLPRGVERSIMGGSKSINNMACGYSSNEKNVDKPMTDDSDYNSFRPSTNYPMLPPSPTGIQQAVTHQQKQQQQQSVPEYSRPKSPTNFKSLPATRTPDLQETWPTFMSHPPLQYSSSKNNQTKWSFDGPSISTGFRRPLDKVQRSNQNQAQGRDSNNATIVPTNENELPSHCDGIRFTGDNGINRSDSKLSYPSHSSVLTGSSDRLKADYMHRGSGQYWTDKPVVKSCQSIARDKFQIKEDIMFTSGPSYKRNTGNMAAPSFIDYNRAHLPLIHTENKPLMPHAITGLNNQSQMTQQNYELPDTRHRDLPSNDSWQEDGGFSGSFPGDVPRIQTHTRHRGDKKTVHIHHFHSDPLMATDDLIRDDRFLPAKTGSSRDVVNPTSPHYNLIGCNVVQIGSSNAVQQPDTTGSTNGQINTDLRVLRTKESTSHYSTTDDDDDDDDIEEEDNRDDTSCTKSGGYRNNQDVNRRNIQNIEFGMKNNLSLDQQPSDSSYTSGTLASDFNIQHQDVSKLKNDEDFNDNNQISEGKLGTFDTSNFESSTPFKWYSSSEKHIKDGTTCTLNDSINNCNELYTKLSSEQPGGKTQKTKSFDKDKDGVYKDKDGVYKDKDEVYKGKDFTSSLQCQSDFTCEEKQKQVSYTTQTKGECGYDMENVYGDHKEKYNSTLQCETDTISDEQLFTNSNTDNGNDKELMQCESDNLDKKEQYGSKMETGDDDMLSILKDHNLKQSTLQGIEEQPLRNMVNNDSVERNNFKVGFIFQVDQKYTPGCKVRRQISTCLPVYTEKIRGTADNNDSDDLD